MQKHIENVKKKTERMVRVSVVPFYMNIPIPIVITRSGKVKLGMLHIEVGTKGERE